MTKPANPPATAATTGGKDRPWHMRAWSGITAAAYWRVLARHGFRISPTRLPMASMLAGISLMNSSMALLQKMVYGKRIAQTELAGPPIFVVGHWRSGTTLLHELMVLDRQFTFPNTYACFCPNHFLISQRWLKPLLTLFLPKQRPMDNMQIGWNLPQEDEWALCNMGLPSPYFKVLFPNLPMQDRDYQTLRGLPADARKAWQDGMQWLLRCLTLSENRPVVLKTPLHTFRLSVLLEKFPQAKFIHISRNPYQLFPSTVHTWKRMYSYQGLQVPKLEDLEQQVLQTFCEMYDAFEDDRQQVPAGQFYQLSYEQLSTDPVRELAKIYEHFDMEASDQARQAWQDYAAKHRNYEKNRHQLSAAQKAAIEQHWGPYFDRYGYARETQS